jgi:broad specificity phosphatase PhoE
MALLTLVRHGQASYLKENYDQLSDLGNRQARMLGEYWIRTKTSFDQVYYGPACRHLRTGQIVADVYRQAGQPWPEPVTVRDMDEYVGTAIVRTFLPGLLETHEDIRALEAEYRRAEDQHAAFKMYDKLFARISRMWVDGELDSPELESWKNFCARIDRGIQMIRDSAGENKRIVVFTSGGVIAASARLALDLAPQRTLELSWASRNASYTELVFTPERIWLSSFNNHPHLEDEALLTHR